MGAFSDLVPILINLDVGAFRLQLLHLIKMVLINESRVIIPQAASLGWSRIHQYDITMRDIFPMNTYISLLYK